MSIATGDVRFMRSYSLGSTGGIMDAVEIETGTQNNLFDDVPDPDRIAGGTMTKKWFLKNANVTDAMTKPMVWLGLQPRNITEELGLGFDDQYDTDSLCGNMTELAGDSTVELVSNSTDDRTVDLYGVSSTGVATKETVAMTGSTPVETVTVWAVVYAAHVSAKGNPTITLTTTIDDATIGVITGAGNQRVCCFLWREPWTAGESFQLPDLAADSGYGFWDRLTWTANIGGVRPDTSTISVQENVA
jgi:hypothetical protein